MDYHARRITSINMLMELKINVQQNIQVAVDVVPPVLPGQAFVLASNGSLDYKLCKRAYVSHTEMVGTVAVAFGWRVSSDDCTITVYQFLSNAQSLLSNERFEKLRSDCARVTMGFQAVSQ